MGKMKEIYTGIMEQVESAHKELTNYLNDQDTWFNQNHSISLRRMVNNGQSMRKT